MNSAGADGAIFFLNIVRCCNFTEARSREVCTVYRKTGYFSKTERRLQQNVPSGPRVR